MPAPKEILDLVERFKRNREEYESGKYNETQLRREFLDPFFKALGWDVINEKGYAEAYKEVIHEDAIKIGAATKAPDYCFRIGGTRKFFLEAKKPSVNIKDDLSPAFQLRRYAWSAKLPLSILSDFEELAVYDCRVKPYKTDKSNTARLMYFTFDQYADKWDGIYSIFSQEAVLNGSFDKFADSSRGKKGTTTVDEAFLGEIEKWRNELAKNIASRNSKLTVHELNFSVQKIIDRIIFLRISEDRGIEQYGKLLSLINGTKIYDRLTQTFQRADERFNSGLFHFQKEKDRPEQPDELTLDLKIDDKVFKDMIGSLYYPESPYEFSALPADILGQVYEQFLGKVIRLTTGHNAVVEDKPAVKKAGGVFYTPTYIVEYIVKNTVGTLCEGKTPKQISKLKILDPACGSGSFLIGAYQFLLDWHRDWFVKDDPKNHQKELYQGIGGDWRLTTETRKKILLNNIYGVDIDPQAVEVTKLSLLLKVLEGESDQTLKKQLEIFHQRALPDLGSNIKCGNSLIGPDYFSGQLLSDPEDLRRVNPFDWEKEFQDVIQGGGFDAIIGNPPYIRIQVMKEWAPLEVEIYKEKFQSASSGNYDIYVVFVEKGLGLLNKQGKLGFILPHKFFNAQYGEGIRKIISNGKHLSHVVHFGDQQVFKDATTYTCLLFLNKEENEKLNLHKVSDLLEWSISKKADHTEISSGKLSEREWNFASSRNAPLFEKLEEIPLKLGDVSERIYQGVITSADSIYLFKEFKQKKGFVEVFSKRLGKWIDLEDGVVKRVVRSGGIGRYFASVEALLLFPYLVENNTATLLSRQDFIKKFPKAWSYLEENKKILEDREEGSFKDDKWYRFGRSQNLGLWEQPKLMIPYMTTRLAAYPDLDENYYFVNVTTGGYGITLKKGFGDIRYICALLNSKLLNFHFKNLSSNFHGGYFAANKQFIDRLSIKKINPSNNREKEIGEQILKIVGDITGLKRSAVSLQGHEKELQERRIETLEKNVDSHIYELYGLSTEEIGIVESD